MVRSHSFQRSSVEMSEILVQSLYGQYKMCTDGTQQNKWDPIRNNTLMLQFMSETASKWVNLTPRLGRSVRSMINYVLDSCRQTLHLELAVQSMKVPWEPILISEKWRQTLFSTLCADRSALCTSMHSLRQCAWNWN